jgi:hypothetical protein
MFLITKKAFASMFGGNHGEGVCENKLRIFLSLTTFRNLYNFPYIYPLSFYFLLQLLIFLGNLKADR